MATLVVAAGAVLGVAAPASAAPADTIYSLVNQARAAHGLRGLIRNPVIDGVAVNWANQMGASGSMTHNPSYSSQIPGGWTGAGENVAMGYPSAETMFNGWMNSPGHRMLAAVAGAVLIGGALALTLRRRRRAPADGANFRLLGIYPPKRPC
jgi:hypothetical protein